MRSFTIKKGKEYILSPQEMPGMRTILTIVKLRKKRWSLLLCLRKKLFQTIASHSCKKR
jgi:hypothetical protein